VETEAVEMAAAETAVAADVAAGAAEGAGISALGAGLSYRPRWRESVLGAGATLGCVELVAEHYLQGPPDRWEELDQLASVFPVLPHGIGLSIGTQAPLDAEYVRDVARLVERVRAPWYSEHLAYTQASGVQIGHLAPLPFSEEAVQAVARNVREWRDVAGVPLLLENIAYLVSIPGEMTEAQFITEVLDRTGCGLLLDLHNLYANARNHGYDAIEFLNAIPLERVRQVHIAGGHDEGGYRIDSHSAPAPPEVWGLLRWLAARIQIEAAVVEWDVALPPFETLLAEVEMAAQLMEGGCHGAR
jgi:uncharacterized protein (UPF0276 family)